MKRTLKMSYRITEFDGNNNFYDDRGDDILKLLTDIEKLKFSDNLLGQYLKNCSELWQRY